MFEYLVYTYGSQVLLLILCILFGGLGFLARRVADRFLKDDAKRTIVRTVVQYVEQVWTELHGRDKLHKALETASKLLSDQKIPFTVDELEVLIEAAVAEFNKAFEKPLEREDTSEAIRRVENSKIPDSVQPNTETVSR